MDKGVFLICFQVPPRYEGNEVSGGDDENDKKAITISRIAKSDMAIPEPMPEERYMLLHVVVT